jgi:ribonuclease T2
MGQSRGVPGRFDYWVLSLSWSPAHCAGPQGKRDDYQCAGERKYGFIVHGLWPQFERGWPVSCASGAGPDSTTIGEMLPTMPSPGLIRHEWQKHGTCSGLAPRQYFARIRDTFRSVRIPPDYREPLRQIIVKPAEIESRFAAANPGMTPLSIGVVCSGNGRFLQEVRLCLDKGMKPRPCSPDIRDCRSAEIIMQPVR